MWEKNNEIKISFKANLNRGLLIRVTCIGVLVEPSVAAVLQSG